MNTDQRTLWMWLGAGVLAVAQVAGCERGTLSGPPTLRLGRDECAECGMLINEDRCACAVVLDVEGRREHATFDDIGCLLDFERHGSKGGTIIERHLRDYGAGGWVNAQHAALVFAKRERLATPMGSGMVAFGSADAAAKEAAKTDGRVLDFAGATEARRAWLEERYGSGKAPPP